MSEVVTEVEGPYLCSITRVHNEHIKFKSFIRHQLREGFDRIVILDDRSEPSLEWDDPRVEIYPVNLPRVVSDASRKKGSFVFPTRAIHPFLRAFVDRRLIECTWVANVDVDEFITTRRNEDRTTREELMASFEAFEAVHVPWVMYGNELSPDVRIEGDVASEVI